MIPDTCTGPFEWDRVKDIAQIYCRCCGTTFYIPQCCEDEKCGGKCA